MSLLKWNFEDAPDHNLRSRDSIRTNQVVIPDALKSGVKARVRHVAPSRHCPALDPVCSLLRVSLQYITACDFFPSENQKLGCIAASPHIDTPCVYPMMLPADSSMAALHDLSPHP